MVQKMFKCMAFLIVLSFIVSGPILFDKYKAYNQNLPANNEEQWKGVILLWDYPYFDKEKGTRYGWITQKIKQFEKENKGVFIDFKPIHPKYGIYEIETAVKTNALPDIAPVGGEIDIQKLEILEPLNSFIPINNLEQYTKGVAKTIVYKENIYGIPRLINLHVLALNRYALDSIGVSVPETIHWTQNDFFETSEVLYQNTKIPFKAEEKTILSMNLYLEDSRELENLIKRTGFHHSNSIISDFEKRNVSIASCSTMDLARLDYYMGGNSEYKLMNYYNNESEEKVIGDCIAYGIFKQEDKKKLEMCYKFIHFLADDNEQLQLWKFNAFPVKKDINNIYSKKSDMGELEDFILQSDKIFINSLTRQEKIDWMNRYESISKP